MSRRMIYALLLLSCVVCAGIAVQYPLVLLVGGPLIALGFWKNRRA